MYPLCCRCNFKSDLHCVDRQLNGWNNSDENGATLFYIISLGADLLRLNRDDLIQICGLADGIRLNNALQSK